MEGIKAKARQKVAKKIAHQFIMACPKCGQPNATCDCGVSAKPMTKGAAADLAIYSTMERFLRHA